MLNKVIGIVGKSLSDGFGVQTAYMEYFSKFGNIRIIMPTDTEVLKIDLLVLPGGRDIINNNSGYPQYSNGVADPHLEWFDKEVLPKYIFDMTPVFGICRGFQAINCYFGGTLKQNLIYHEYSKTRQELSQEVYYVDNEKKKFKVNSLHHQAVERLGQHLIPILASKDEGDGIIIEAFRHNKLPISAVQWHPKVLGLYVVKYR